MNLVSVSLYILGNLSKRLPPSPKLKIRPLLLTYTFEQDPAIEYDQVMLSLKRGHLANQDKILGPKYVHIRGAPLYTYHNSSVNM